MHNVHEFKDGQTLYLYFYGFQKDKSGRCKHGYANTLPDALKKSACGKIYKIKLEEIQLELTTEKITTEQSKWKIV